MNTSPVLPLPALALAVKAGDPPDHIAWAIENHFALEYTPDPLALDQVPIHLGPAIRAGVPIRFHGRYYGHEIGHPDPHISDTAMRVHSETFRVMREMRQFCEQVVTFHLDLCWGNPFDPDKAVANLKRLVEEAGSLGITVSIENLRGGSASHPENVREWAGKSGASITLDVGHAVSCHQVQRGGLDVTDFIHLFADRLVEVHMYGYESDRHYPITDIEPFRPIVENLLRTSCRWWTIELENRDEALSTRDLLRECFPAGAGVCQGQDFSMSLADIHNRGQGYFGTSLKGIPRASATPLP